MAEFEKRLLPSEEPMVADYRRHGRAALAPAVQLEMALAAYRFACDEEASLLSDVRFAAPTVWKNDEPHLVRLVIDADETSAEARVFVRAESAAAGAEAPAVCQAQIRATALSDRPRLSLADIRRRCTTNISAEEATNRLTEQATELGHAYAELRSIRQGSEEVLARLELTAPSDDDDAYALHPAVVQAGLELGRWALPNDAVNPLTDWEVASIDAIEIHEPVQGSVWCWVRTLAPNDAAGEAPGVEFAFCDDRGHLLAALLGVRWRDVGQAIASHSAPLTTGLDRELYFERTWVETTLVPRRALPVGAWLIFGAADGPADALTERLAGDETTVIRVGVGQKYRGLRSRGGRRGNGHCELADREQIGRLLDDCRKKHGRIAGAVFLAEEIQADKTEPDQTSACDAALSQGPVALAHVLQGLASAASQEVETWVVTRNGSPTNDTLGSVNPWMAPLAGLARVAAKEFSNWKVRVLDLATSDHKASAAQIAAAMLARDCPRELAVRGQRWFEPRLRRAEVLHLAGERQLLRRGGTYLITGGQAGIGLELAKWLVAQCAETTSDSKDQTELSGAAAGKPSRRDDATPVCRLILVSRTPLPNQAEWDTWLANHDTEDVASQRILAVQQLRGLGAEVWPVAADVADGAALQRLLNEVRTRYGALDGIVHAAGVLRDRSLIQMTDDQLLSVLRPKVHGAWLLHTLTADMPLKFFALCSSVAALTAGEGQAAHVAANMFEDALAHYRSQRGLPALSVNWGFWGETGVVAAPHYRQNLAEFGVRPLSNAQGQLGFATALALGKTQLAVADIDWKRIAIDLIESPPGWAEVEASIRSESQTAWADLETHMRSLSGFDADCDALVAAHAAAALAAAGLFLQAGERHTLENIQAAIGAAPKNQGLCEQLVQMLVDDGVLRREEGVYVAKRKLPRHRAKELQASLEANYPAAAALCRLLERCGRQLLPALRGEVEPLTLLMPDGDAAAVEGAYADSPLNRYYQRLICAAVRGAMRCSTAQRPLEILEIGAGTGATTAAIVADMAAGTFRHTYTDVSPHLVAHGRRRFGGRPELQFQALDIERSPVEQGLAAGQYDVVIAANVLHATRDLAVSLRHVRGLLRPGGLLVLSETTRDKRFAQITFGLTDGWRRFTDRELRTASPLLAVDRWVKLLGDQGFATAAGWPRNVPELDLAGEHVLAAMLPETAAVDLSSPDDLAAAPRIAQSATGTKTDHSTAAAATLTAALTPQQAQPLLEEELTSLFAAALEWDVQQVAVDRPFHELGLDSLMAIDAVRRIKDRFMLPALNSAVLFAYPTIRQLAQHLAAKFPDSMAAAFAQMPPARDARSLALSPREVTTAERSVADLPTATSAEHALPPSEPLSADLADVSAVDGQSADDKAVDSAEQHHAAVVGDIAIVGYACKFPGAHDAGAYWELLRTGRDAVGPPPTGRVDVDKFSPSARGGAAVAVCGGFLPAAALEEFDPLFFHLAPAEAAQMEPRQRLFLETAYAAIEHAGYAGRQLDGTRTGVFVGAGAQLTVDADDEIDVHWATGITPSVLASRVAYHLNLRGPCLSVDTACSSSMMALHLAVSSLRRGESELALVGGVHLNVQPLNYAAFVEMGALAADGRVKAFDERADGFVPGEGCGAVLLKPLAQAQADGDRVYGVIKGTAANNDGRSNGLTAPNPEAQSDVIVDAWRDAGIDPTTLSYVEAHGTGTALGDPIEIRGLSEAFARHTRRRQFCRLGSVKSNIGHAEPAAGMASLIKVLLSFEHGQLPPTLHFESPNRELAFEETPLVVNDRMAAWRSPMGPRRAGINSFGISGTNVHIVLEEPPAEPPRPTWPERPRHALALSAVSWEALAQLATRFAEQLEALGGGASRSPSAVVGEITAAEPTSVKPPDLTAAAASAERTLADFCYTANTGRPALATHLLITGISPAEIAAQLRIAARQGEQRDGPAAPRLAAPRVMAWFAGMPPLDAALELYDTQPVFREALDACAQAIASPEAPPLLAWLRQQAAASGTGASGDAFAVAAACAVQIAIWRMWHSWGVHANLCGAGPGWLAAACASGALPLAEGLAAAQRATRLCNAAQQDVDRERGQHSARQALAAELQQLHWRAPLSPLLAPTTGHSVSIGGTLDPQEMADWITRDLDGSSASEDLDWLGQADRVVLRLGSAEPASDVRTYAAPSRTVVQSLEPGREAWSSIGHALAALANFGVEFDWAGFDRPYRRRRMAAPAYPFQRRVVRPLRRRTRPSHGVAAAPVVHPLPNATALDERTWLHLPGWSAAPALSTATLAPGAWLLIGDESATLASIAHRLEQAAQTVTIASPSFVVDQSLENPSLADPLPGGHKRRGIVCVVDCNAKPTQAANIAAELTNTLGQFLGLAHLLAHRGDTIGPLLVVTVSDIDGSTACDDRGPRMSPKAAAVAGLMQTLRLEAPQHPVRCVHWQGGTLPIAEVVARELALPDGPALIAHCRDGRFVPTLVPAAHDPAARQPLRVRSGGTYLITGGQSGVGIELAAALVEELQCNSVGVPSVCLVLVNRTPLPDETQWDAWQASHDADDIVSQRILGVRRLRALGAHALPLAADVSDESSLRKALSEAVRQCGPIDGVIHAAGELRDHRLCVSALADVQAVLAPKVGGAACLDRLLIAETPRALRPVWIVYCSSVAARWGRIGQGAYAAANAWLDALADSTSADDTEGTRRVSLAWGPWSAVGMAARTFNDDELARRGALAIAPEQGRRLFRAALALGGWNVVVYQSAQEHAATKVSAPDRGRTALAVDSDRTTAEWSERIAVELAACLGLERADISPRRNFQELGLDSMTAVRIRQRLERQAGRSLDPTLLFAYPTVELLAQELATCAAGAPQVRPAAGPLVSVTKPQRGIAEPMAIVGMACRFGNCTSAAEFWDAICRGADLVTPLSAQRAAQCGMNPPAAPLLGGWLADIDQFDAELFGLTVREARRMDPQQRLLLETVWEAVQQAGYVPARLGDGRCGMFVGVSNNEYLSLLARAGQLVDPHTGAGNSLALIANRVSYFCNWRGPSLAVDTACSSSLAALHLARQALESGECRAAVVAGVNLILSPAGTLACQQAGMMAADGHCKPFDQRADGYVRSEGVAAVVLKPLPQAQADGDCIWAVLKSTALNHDGHAKLGLTAPNPHAQREALEEAWRRAGVEPESLGVLEAHGTGTPLGDPIEIRAVTQAMRRQTRRRSYCALGSVKSNLGHAEAAAGLAGLIKAVWAVNTQTLPPTAHVGEPNRALALEDSPLYWNDRLRPWPSGGPCRAGVSSFGFGGVNVHAVIEEPPPQASRHDTAARAPYVLACSAASPQALAAVAADLAKVIVQGRAPLGDITFTSNTSRTGLAYRLAVVGHTAAELAAALRDYVQRAPDEIGRTIALTENIFAGVAEASADSAAARAELPTTTAGSLESARSAAWAYANGQAIDWQAYYADGACRRVPLPSYPFQRQRCWIDVSPSTSDGGTAALKAPRGSSTQKPLPADWLYEQVWTQHAAPRRNRRSTATTVRRLLFTDESPLAARLIERLRESGDLALEMTPSNRFVVQDDRISIDPAQADHYAQLVDELAAREALPQQVVHLWSLRSTNGDLMATMSTHLTTSLYSVVHFVQAWKRRFPQRPLDLRIVTAGAQDVAGGAVTQPVSAAVWGLARAIGRECYPLACQAIEWTAGVSPATAAGFADAVCEELQRTGDAPEVALGTDGLRWTPTRRAMTLPAAMPSLLTPGGVYLITGGVSGIGLAVAEHLGRHWQARLALLSRRGRLPAENSAVLRDAGENVLTLAADVSDQAAMQRAIEQISHRFGRLDGVVHAAGVIETARLTEMTAAHIERTLAAKVAGTILLDNITRTLRPRFLALFSSLAGLEGNVLQADYSAANRFLDSFAQWRSAQGWATRVFDWPTWADVGRAAGAAHLEQSQQLPAAVGLEIFETALAHDRVQWVVAPPTVVAPAAPPWRNAETTAPAPAVRPREMERALLERLAAALETPVEKLDAAQGVVDLGVDSILAAAFARRLEGELGVRVSRTVLFDYATIERLARFLCESEPAACAKLLTAVSPTQPQMEIASHVITATAAADAKVPIAPRQHSASEPIAVIAMAGRFAAAENVDDFWEKLCAGFDLVGEMPASRADYGLLNTARNGPDHERRVWGGFLPELDAFDPDYFRISLREAQAMHPQQRLLLETAAEALERFGYAGPRLAGSKTGVFVAAAPAAPSAPELTAADQPHLATGYAPAMLANRLSYWLDLRGPSLVIDTACSSSLVALHMAVQSLRRGECAQALVAGVQAGVTVGQYAALERMGALAAGGRCRSFDNAADGYVPGEGIGVALLKPLAQALADGDQVLGLIRGTAVGHGGLAAGLTVPRAEAQAEVIRAALTDAQVAADSIQYIEAHGTGTALGDPIELRGIDLALGPLAPRRQFVAIGSVKSNLGHLEAAAGMAALVKVLLALRHGYIPRTLHVQRPNDAIEFPRSVCYVCDRGQAWPNANGPRRAGISAFGFGGANAHVIVEEPPAAPLPSAWPASSDRPAHVAVLSAPSPEALQQHAQNMAGHAAAHPDLSLADAAFTLNTGRPRREHRLAIAAATTAEWQSALAAYASGAPSQARWPAVRASERITGRRPRIAWLFTGQGSQYVGMAQALSESQPQFRAALDQCATLLQGELDVPLKALLYDAAVAVKLNETRYAQPALFAIEWALAQMWTAWGIEPDLLIGHSLGEYVAAAVAGVLSLPDALRLVARRAKWMQALPSGGGMAAVGADATQLADLMRQHAQVEIAAVNGPEQTVLSGPLTALERLTERCVAAGFSVQRLDVSHAFHCRSVEPMLAALTAEARTMTHAAPRVPLVSNLTGEPFAAGVGPGAEYWAEHARHTVRFATGVKSLQAAACDVLLEIGPRPTLIGFAKQVLEADSTVFAHSLAPGADNWRTLATAMAELAARGVNVDWQAFDAPYPRRRVELPASPLQRRSMRREEPRESAVTSPSAAAALQPASTPAANSSLLWQRVWRPSPWSEPSRSVPPGAWLILVDGQQETAARLAQTLAVQLQRSGARPIEVRIDQPHSDWRQDRCGCDLTDDEQIGQLVATLGRRELLVAGVIVLIAEPAQGSLLGLGAELRQFSTALTRTVGGAVNLFNLLVERQPSRMPELWSITWSDAAEPMSAESTNPAAASPLWRIVPEEFPGAVARAVNLGRPATIRDAAKRIVEELEHPQGERQATYRRGVRLAPTIVAFEPLPDRSTLPIRPGGTYLITGGLGDVGRHLADWVVEKCARARIESRRRESRTESDRSQLDAPSPFGVEPVCRLVLVQRTPLPDESQWDALLARAAANDPLAVQMQAVRRLRGQGAEVQVATADVADLSAMDELLAKIRSRYGALDGVIHAAGWLQDRALWERSSESLDDVLRAKAFGTWVLDRLTRRDPPPLFLVCSSMSVWQGGAGHASYAAANAAASAIVEARREVGLPAMSIHWGPWAGTRAAELPRYREKLSTSGVELMSPAEATAALEQALCSDQTQLGVMRTTALCEIATITTAQRAAATSLHRRLPQLADALHRLAPLEPVLARICAAYVVQWLVADDKADALPATFTVADVVRSRQVTRGRAALVERLLELPLAVAHLQQHGDGFRFIDHSGLDDPERLMQSARHEFAEQAPLFDVIERSGSMLGEILAGRASAVEALFAGASAEALEGLYAASPVVTCLGDVAGAAIAALAKRRLADRPLRVLEIGAGTGATTRRVLAQLADAACEYTVTDLSPALVSRAAAAFASLPQVRCGALDIQRDPAAQGFAAGDYDVVLAANVLHATRRLDETLNHVKRLLAPGGVLALIEAVRTPPVGWLTFGLTDGWWQFEDPRTQGPLLDAAAWTAVLAQHGFREIAPLPAGNGPHDLEQRLFLTQRATVLPTADRATSIVTPRALPQSVEAHSPVAASARSLSNSDIRRAVRDEVAAVLRESPEKLSTQRTFQELGVDSILALEMLQRLHARLGVAGLTPGVLFAHPSVDELASHLATRLPVPHAAVTTTTPARVIASSRSTRDIAIIGFAGKFPQADSADALWPLLTEGRHLVGPLPADRRRLATGYDPAAATWIDETAPCGGYLSHIDQFDPLFFHISPAEACEMDPRQRLFLESAWRAIEHAGHAGKTLAGSRTGVFVGVGPQDYLTGAAAADLSQFAASGAAPSALASRIAYLLDLHGPCLAVDTACSSSLVALQLAVDSLRSGQCDTALAGGVHLNLRLGSHVVFERLGALSPTAACRAFSAQADGFAPGEAVGAVLLKPLDAALAAGDCVYGVITGVAANNDGHTNGLTAPNPTAQRDVILAAWRDAELDPSTLNYIEAHGTGTALGDPVEVEAICAAMAHHTTRKQFCRLGSVKSNIGHAEAAAGIAGLIKMLLAFQHEQLPASLHMDAPNRHILFEETPLVVNDQTQPWRRSDTPRRAALSAFGFSGTNVHLVLQEPPRPAPRDLPNNEPQALVLSARSADALRETARELAEHLAAIAEPATEALADVCWTLQTGRPSGRCRVALVGLDAQLIATQLRLIAAQRSQHAVANLCTFDVGDGPADRDWFDRHAAPRVQRLSQHDRTRLQGACGGPCWQDTLSAWFDHASAPPGPAESAEGELTTVAAALYVAGAEVDWSQIANHQGRRRVALPAAPMQRQAFWLPGLLERAAAAESSVQPLGTDSAPNVLYQVEWRPAPLEQSPRALTPGAWLIFDDESGLGSVIEPLLAPHGPVVRVVRGPFWAQLGPHTFQISPTREADYLELLSHVAKLSAAAGSIPLAGIVHLWNYQPNSRAALSANSPQSLDALDRGLETGVDALLTLAHALVGSRRFAQSQLLLVTTNAQPVLPADVVASDRGALLGLAQVLPAELPGLAVQAVDVTFQRQPTELAAQLVAELCATTGDAEVALRGHDRWVRSLAHVSLPTPNSWALAAPGEVHLITGGLGGVGQQLAHRLAAQAPVHLVLTGRRATADAGLLAMGREIGAADRSATVEYRRCDVSIEQDVEQLVEYVRRRYGRLDCVWHAAGKLDRQRLSLRTKSLASFHEVLAPKVHGTSLLWHATRALAPKRFVLFSSLSALSGTLAAGQSDYAAAARFQQLFAAAARRGGDASVVCLLLSEWKSTGMTAHEGAGPLVEQLGLLPLDSDQALQAIARSVSAGVEHVAVIHPDAARFRASALLAMAAPRSLAARSVPGPMQLAERPAQRRVDVRDDIELAVLTECARLLRAPVDQFDGNTNFMELGFDSVVALQLARWLEAELGQPVDATWFFHYPTPRAIAQRVCELQPVRRPQAQKNELPKREPQITVDAPPDVAALALRTDAAPVSLGPSSRVTPIAVIGLACRFPDAATPADFWRNLCQGKDSVAEMPPDRRRLLSRRGNAATGGNAPPRGGYLSHIEDFDAALFQLSAREARLMDPQQRLLLEVAWEALESAGYPPGGAAGSTGVYVGVSTQDYVQLVADEADRRDPHLRAGNALSMIANRVSYLLNLTGPSLCVDTACSSSLAALHLACQALHSGETEMALAGGVHLNLNADGDAILTREGMLAADGRAKVFDDQADGFVRGEGAAVVVLKPLSAAVRDGDAVWGVIRGTAVNNDGHTKAGLAAPNPRAQTDVILAAWRQAQVAPESIGYVEAHGTGTALGDPLELQALATAFRQFTRQRGFCAVGSVKSNVGHLEAAAGMAGLLKALLAVAHGAIPPTLHFQRPNRAVQMEDSPLYIADRLQPWPQAGPRRTGVSSFGFGGTNVHVVLEQTPPDAFAAVSDGGPDNGRRASRQESPPPDEPQ